jgi:hypothetical protein
VALQNRWPLLWLREAGAFALRAAITLNSEVKLLRRRGVKAI